MNKSYYNKFFKKLFFNQSNKSFFKMKKIILIILLIIIQNLNSQSTNYTVTKSRLFKEIFTNTRLIKVIEDDNGEYYTIRHYDQDVSDEHFKGFIVQKWNNTQKCISYKKYIIETDKKGFISGMFVNNDKFYVLEFVKNKTVECFIHSSKENTSKLKKNKLFSFNIQEFPNYLFNKKIDSNNKGGLKFSPNGNNILFHIDVNNQDYEQHKIFVFNDNLQPLWNKEFKDKKADKLFDFKNIQIDNKGNVYLLGKNFSNPLHSEANYNFKLFKITPKSTENLILDTKKNFVKTLSLKINKYHIDCIGFFSKEDENMTKGSVFFSVNKESLKLLKSNFQHFSSKIMVDKFGKERIKELSNYIINNISPLKNGGYIVSGEEYYSSINIYNGFQTSTTELAPATKYNYDDIIIFRLAKNGDLIWSRNINKKQSSLNHQPPTFSYSLLINQQNTFIFLNAHKKLRELTRNRKEFKSDLLGFITKKNSNLYAIRLDNVNGKMSATILQKNKDSDVIFKIGQAQKIGNSKMIVFGSKEKMSQMLVIQLNE